MYEALTGVSDDEYLESIEDTYDDLLESSKEPYFVIARFCNECSVERTKEFIQLVNSLHKQNELIYYMLYNYYEANWDWDIEDNERQSTDKISDEHIELYKILKAIFNNIHSSEMEEWVNSIL